MINNKIFDANGNNGDDIDSVDGGSPHKNLSEDDLGAASPNIGPRQL